MDTIVDMGNKNIMPRAITVNQQMSIDGDKEMGVCNLDDDQGADNAVGEDDVNKMTITGNERVQNQGQHTIYQGDNQINVVWDESQGAMDKNQGAVENKVTYLVI